ncbi:MAG TPA: thiopurine S-methyltransferase [Kofleriaceae bacterium]|nr:thiopurine S-methyltransferase [Kofleriaceae bacterium]
MSTSIDRDFWADRWRGGQLGFHEGKPNGFVERHAAHLGSGRRVLVPLCGKAVDLAYLAGLGHDVVGVELVEEAAAAFFAEHGLAPTVARDGAFTRYQAGAITLLVGDVFATSPGVVGPLDALYDRAALIALPPDLRGRYVAHVRSLFAAGAPGLLVTIEYPQELMAGPPFSVPEDEVRRHYAGAEVVVAGDQPVAHHRLRPGDVARERCYTLRL